MTYLPQILLLLLFGSLSSVVFGQQDPPQNEILTPSVLELNQPIEREIAPRNKQIYQFTLAESQYVSVTVEQRGIDVAVSVFGSDKKGILQKDSILKADGLEKINFVALTAGNYFLQVEGKQNFSASGHYVIQFLEQRPSNEKEHHLEQARSLYQEAWRLWNNGVYIEAKTKAEQALEIRVKELGEDDIDVAASMVNLAVIDLKLGNYEKAIILNQSALKIREKVLGTYHQDVGQAVHNLATVYFELGRYDEALRLYEKAVDIYEKVYSPNDLEVATTLSSIGAIYLNLANYDKAEEFTKRALNIREKKLSPDSPAIVPTLSNLAAIYTAKGDTDAALDLNKRALEILEKTLNPNHPEIANSLVKLASSEIYLEDYKQAEAHYLRALNIFQKAYGAEHHRIAVLLGYLAWLYNLQNDLPKAESLHIKCVNMMLKTVGELHPDYAIALFNQALFYTRIGNYSKAEPLYQKALTINEKIWGGYHPNVIANLNGMARNYAAQGNSTQAVNLWTQAHKLREQSIQSIFFANSERQRRLYLNSLSSETNQFISAHLQLAPANPLALNLALTTIFERKGRILDAAAFEFSNLRNRLNKNDQDLLDKYKAVTSQLGQKILKGSQNLSSEEYRKQIKDLEAQKESIEVEISRRSVDLSSQIQPVTISAIQSAIPQDGALIEFSNYRPFSPKNFGSDTAYGALRYVAYIVDKQHIQWKDLGDAKQIDDAIFAWREALSDPKRSDVNSLARIVNEKIMLPISPLLGDAKHIFVSSDAALNLIPFEALVDEKNHFQVENYLFTYLTSGRDLLRMKTVNKINNKPLIIANPLFGDPNNKLSITDKNQSINIARDLSGTYFAPLTGTAQEARLIQEVFPEAELLTGINATKAALKQINAPSILHLATHGFFLQDKEIHRKRFVQSIDENALDFQIEDQMLRSGLALAGANQQISSTGDDGILTAFEASGLNLSGTKLVVLSACDTGLGAVKNGEGVYGLRRAFVLAGTESLVMSLWSVSDYVTRELMVNYYKNLKQGMGRGQALRQIQLEMMKRKGREHPFYWAAFIQSGDWKNLNGQF